MDRKDSKEPAGRNMGISGKVKKAIGWLSVLAGSALGFYIGVCRMFLPSLLGLVTTCMENRLAIAPIIFTLVKCWLALTMNGLIWLIGYKIKCKLDVG